MIARCCIIGRRKIHSTTNILCQFKFSDEETEKILSVVNSSTVEDLTGRYAISNIRAKSLYSRRQLSGKNVESIQEMVTGGGFTAQLLNKFCTSILNGGNSSVLGDDGIKRQKHRSYTSPPLSSKLVNNVKSFTSLHCGMTGMSWSRFEITPNEVTKVTHWDWMPLPGAKLSMYQLVAFMTDVSKEIPSSDFYVFENLTVFNNGSKAKANLNTQLSQMIGMASVLAAQKSTLLAPDEMSFSDSEFGTTNVTYLRKFLFARLFQLYVGSERISTVKYVEDLISLTNVSRVVDANIQTVVDVHPTLTTMYSACQSTDKDFLGCSLLLGLAFLRLVLLNCPKSVKLVR